MRDLARHQELQRVLRAGVRGEVDQTFVDDLGACLCRDVAAEIDVQLARDLQVVRGPCIAHGVIQADPAATRDGDEGVGLCAVAIELHRLEVQPGERADNFQVAQFFGADVHQQVFALCVVAVQPLNGILHCRSQLAVRSAELLEQHVSESRIRLVDADRVHQLLNVVVHCNSPLKGHFPYRLTFLAP